MDCFVACAPRNDGRTYSNFKQPAAYGHGLAISPHVFARVLLVTSRSLPSEGAGNAGSAMRPQPRMQNRKAYELVTTVTPERPGIPRAMVLRLPSRSPRRPRCLPPSPALLPTG